MEKNTAPETHVKARWVGDERILRDGEIVDILCSDPADPSVPARRACWVRHWPEKRDFPQYRSCDLSDLEELREGDFDKLFNPAPQSREAQ